MDIIQLPKIPHKFDKSLFKNPSSIRQKTSPKKAKIKYFLEQDQRQTRKVDVFQADNSLDFKKMTKNKIKALQCSWHSG